MASLLKKEISDVQNAGDDGKEMGFLDHLEELRWHVIRAGLAVIFFATIALIFQNEVFEYIIYAPKKPDFITYKLFCAISEATCFSPPELPLITRELGEQFFMGITVSIYIGVIASFPYIFYEFWKFIKPGLYQTEVKIANRLIGATSFLFILGVSFGYYIIAPFAISFLGSYSVGTEAVNSPTLSSYVSYLTMFTIPIGLAFELPIVVYFLARIGIIGPDIMKKYRREAFLIIFIIAAIITPPDALTQIMVGIPMYILYEISITVASRVVKSNAQKPDQLPS
ncbi:MAG: twin-arginine translocase subunit TatC [Saprospiraceae bacterium]|jgi:sec-independent protein translocase protein TatC|nr:twin-arginine translocase subunit TatC [Saprospiraceae bacterium]MBP6540703.1 twin-arginine translocase subunit TatC [Saprospiraceae bacterium]MBP8213175.1 twin-arginine translocase subunit TatC [Saprospiraceae bacterium]HMT54165.1 twin-arginine translocase subunit TatC [Saprospiraceae bacterium]HMT70435.1 twin-arginine translocase subunit TatC [Saprospiraceae bacterium]